jgi:hypothetical protein
MHAESVGYEINNTVASEVRDPRTAASMPTEYADVKAIMSNNNSDYNFAVPMLRDEYDLGNVSVS